MRPKRRITFGGKSIPLYAHLFREPDGLFHVSEQLAEDVTPADHVIALGTDSPIVPIYCCFFKSTILVEMYGKAWAGIKTGANS